MGLTGEKGEGKGRKRKERKQEKRRKKEERKQGEKEGKKMRKGKHRLVPQCQRNSLGDSNDKKNGYP